MNTPVAQQVAGVGTVQAHTAAFAVILALGLGLLAVSGLAQSTVLHDAAHDQRHALAFPCH
ncbi:MAG: CbtB-domain containing protein [Rhodobacteraceae bacterium]|nr:CbtB-domain containing protein [Paracoccaceae bacterium]